LLVFGESDAFAGDWQSPFDAPLEGFGLHCAAHRFFPARGG
jgi:hypothetical protein